LNALGSPALEISLTSPFCQKIIVFFRIAGITQTTVGTVWGVASCQDSPGDDCLNDAAVKKLQRSAGPESDLTQFFLKDESSQSWAQMVTSFATT
jgi:hypothetical protein